MKKNYVTVHCFSQEPAKNKTSRYNNGTLYFDHFIY